MLDREDKYQKYRTWGMSVIRGATDRGAAAAVAGLLAKSQMHGSLYSLMH